MDHRCTKSGDSFFSGRTLVSEFMSKLKNKIITNQSIDSTGRRGLHFEENYHFVPGLFLTSKRRYAERFFSSVSFYITFRGHTKCRRSLTFCSLPVYFYKIDQCKPVYTFNSTDN